ncbi:MAG: NUDIX hydrolase [Methylobacter sp.]|jgi:8-oxo-dGTP pyrophosphatase MutT (NUDIX family)|uniref:NUDIX hydrolase n=1 Tax=Methylobacter sp. TaxID=2051955 RepID=UPI000562E0D7|nr:NUDIX hydrolase [Methylobacter sp.]MCL7420652.1 NUDIX hydrolase [Methylobacter sp.]
MVWKPHVTVAAVIEQDNRFLLVEEETSNGLQFNQPAGHLEKSEDLIAAVKREVYEETAWHFEPEHVLSIQLWRKNPEFPSFVRICFSGRCHSYNPNQRLDEGIIATHWLSRDEIAAREHRLRSPLVLIAVDEYLSGQRHPLSLLKSFLDLDHA